MRSLECNLQDVLCLIYLNVKENEERSGVLRLGCSVLLLSGHPAARWVAMLLAVAAADQLVCLLILAELVLLYSP